MTSNGHCHVNRMGAQFILDYLNSGGGTRSFPFTECVGPKPFKMGPFEQMSLDVERVVDYGLNVEKALSRTLSLPKTLSETSRGSGLGYW